jgi:hypothetical protein
MLFLFGFPGFSSGFSICQFVISCFRKIFKKFTKEIESWQVADRFLEQRAGVNAVDERLEFARFHEFPRAAADDLFFLVPDKFKNNKLNSYGGNLTFKLMFKTSSEDDEGEARTGSLSARPFEIRLSVLNRIYLFN